MNILGIIKNMKELAGVVRGADPLGILEQELAGALSLYWSTADRILKGSGINLKPLPSDFHSLDKNFFSALFLYSFQRAGISKERRILYAAINQCLRGMVTGCDNILDDEYKKTLDTDLPEKGTKFRSIIDIMVSDRVLFEILLQSSKRGDIASEHVLEASSETIRALTRSGVQEASEEGGICNILEPEEVLSSVHHYKTGVLFKCPWAVPAIIEDIDPKLIAGLENALYDIGMGCQIMDDMTDLSSDIEKSRHNYVVSLIYHDSDATESGKLQALMVSGLVDNERSSLMMQFPRARATAAKASLNYLRSGLGALLDPRHQSLTEPAIQFLANRIGAQRFISGI